MIYLLKKYILKSQFIILLITKFFILHNRLEIPLDYVYYHLAHEQMRYSSQ